ncbi:MAG: Type 1 glutamine amidotransferase-like domain-containing protein [Bdellovibrionales bacterium]
MEIALSSRMKLILYSGGNNKINEALDLELLGLIKKKEPVMSYVPFTFYEHPDHYRDWKRYYKKYGVKNFNYFAPNRDYSPKHLEKVFSGDVIYLSSGNTFIFLNHLRKNKLIPQFKKFVKKGGVLAGMSAGAIVMTPNIMTAQVPSADRDENKHCLTDYKAMSLVGFEFSPHYDWRGSHDQELIQYSKQTRSPIIGCDDGAGLVIVNQRAKLIGPAVKFEKGKRQELHQKWIQL